MRIIQSIKCKLILVEIIVALVKIEARITVYIRHHALPETGITHSHTCPAPAPAYKAEVPHLPMILYIYISDGVQSYYRLTIGQITRIGQTPNSDRTLQVRKYLVKYG